MPYTLTGQWSYMFLTLALDGREWSVSCPGCFTSGARAPDTHRIGGWMDPEPIWTLWIRDSSLGLLGIKLQLADHPAHSLFAILTEWNVFMKFTRMEATPKRHWNWLGRSPVLMSARECGAMHNWSMFLSMSTAVYMMLRFVLFFAFLGYSLSTTGKLVAWLPSDMYLLNIGDSVL